jgi:hypothetical protein
MEALTLMGLTLQSMLCSHEFSPTLVVAIRLNTVSLEPVHEIKQNDQN